MLNRRLLIVAICLLFCSAVSPQNSSAQIKRRAVDTLVLCSSDLQTALVPWINYRRKQGHEIAIRFSKPTARQNKDLIAEYAKGNQLKNVLLVGDAGDRWLDPRKLVPTDMVLAKVNRMFGSEREIATDNPYGDLDEDGIPEISVGRLTADSPTELTNTINRIIRYEQQPVGEAWQRDINLVAGLGGFGKFIDTIIENTTREIITDLIPASYQTSMTYGSWTSPYCPDPRKFSDTTIDCFNRGCLFWVYCGHGSRRELDRILLPDQNHRILDSDSVKKLDCRNGSPIAICLSCYTGAHDGNDDCLAECMMRQPNGPVAVVCGSRVTMPYAMSVMSVEMMNEFFRGDCKTLGELILKAKQRMLAEANAQNEYRQSLDALGQTLSPLPKLLTAECREHIHLMQLIGDPLLRLKRPQDLDLEIESETKEGVPVFSKGDLVTVTGTAALPGTLQLEVAYQRGRLRHRPSFRREYDSSDEAFEKIHDDYLKAQDPVCVRKFVHVSPGKFTVDLEIPAGCRGDCDVRAILLGAKDFAVDSVPINVLSDRQTRRKNEAKNTIRTARRIDE